MNHSEREYVAEVANYFFGKGFVAPHQVNLELAKVLYNVLERSQKCSAAMDFVPRPAGIRPGTRYIVKTIAGIGRRIASGDSRTYEICRRFIGPSFTSEAKIALIGAG